MNAPIKDNEHIRADDEAFMSAYRRARVELGRIPGVVGVAYGLKEKAGDFTPDLAILVYVREKQKEDALPPDRVIPPTFDGYRTDVRVTLPERLNGLTCNDDVKYPTITGGIQIEAAGPRSEPNRIGPGTLGCIVRKRGDTGDDNVYLLTNHHVLLDESRNTTFGDSVYQPWSPRTTPIVTKGTPLGTIEKEFVRKGHVDANGRPVANEPSVDPAPDETAIDPSFEGFYVDCAAVRINLGRFCCGSACSPNDIKWDSTIPFINVGLPPPGVTIEDLNRIKDVRDLRNEPASTAVGTKVVKVGRTTGRTKGEITAVNAPGHSIVHYPPEDPLGHVVAFRYHIIEIKWETAPPTVNPCARDKATDPAVNAFSWAGDSGSLIVDDRNNAVALLYGGTADPNVAGRHLTRACFIVPVLDTLGMCIPTTTGNSHGSSRATDGSGLSLYGGPFDMHDESKTLFSGHGLAGSGPRTVPSPLAVAATDEQRARMRPLLDALRETARGRELEEAFSQLSREMAYLIRNRRPVTVAWHRNRGPAFLACVLGHLRGDAATIPSEIGGITRATALAGMGDVFLRHGSSALRDAIERHRDIVMRLAEVDTAGEWIELLRRAEAEVSA